MYSLVEQKVNEFENYCKNFEGTKFEKRDKALRNAYMQVYLFIDDNVVDKKKKLYFNKRIKEIVVKYGIQ